MLRSALSLKILIMLGIFLAGSTVYARKALSISNLPADVQTDLIKRFPQLEKEKLSLEQVDDIIRYIKLKPQFEIVRVYDDGGATPYRLDFQRTRRIAKVKFAGASSISNNELERTFAVKSEDVFDQQNLIDGGERVRQIYKEQGFFNAVIDIEMPPVSDELVDIVIKINENRQTRIRNVILQSPNEDLNRKLAKELSSFVNDPLTEKTVADIQKKARKYLKKNRYVRAELVGPNLETSSDEAQVTLTFRLEKTEQYTFEYFGVRFLGIREVESVLDLDNFHSANPSVATELAQKIRNDYLARGYARAEVKGEETEGRKPFERKVTFTIDEGPQIKIKDITIHGRISRREKYYINFIEEHSSSLVESGFYNKEDVEVGLKNMVLQMQNNGFLQAKLLSTRTQYNKEKNMVSLFVNIDEGPLTVIESITFSGNNDFSAEELSEVTRLREGPLRLGQLENAIDRIKDFYKDHGYIEMLLLNEKQDLVTYDESNTKASLHFKLFEGPKVTVGSIILEGNDFTKDYVIHKELEFKVNDLLTPNKVEESIARLQRTGFFGTVEIRTLEEKTNVANRTVLVKVTERDPGLFTIGVGATNERSLTLRGYTGIGYRNLFGTGRGVSLRLEGNYNVTDIRYLESRVVLGYLEPYIFDSRVRGRLNITRSATVTDFEIRQISQVNSATVSLEQDFTSHILGIYDVWSLATIRDYGLDGRYVFGDVTQNIATTGPTLDIDFRDNPFTPAKGTFTRISAEYSAPWLGSSQSENSSIEYWRATGSFTHYWSVARWQRQPVVWANQVRGGYLKNISDRPLGGVPWDKKGFILGGQSTLRGYEAGTQEVFPNRQDLGLSASDRTYFLKTDSTMFLFKSEMRFPLYGSIGGAVFYDGGSVEIQGLDFPDKYRDSAGFGIRYNTPVGPVSLELAWKLDQRENEEPWRFHLSIGSF